MPRLSAGSRMTLSQMLRLGVFLGGSLLAASVFLLAHWAIGRLTRETATTSRVLARLCAQVSFPATRDPALQEVVAGIIENIDFPIVLTDRHGLPRAWKGIDVPTGLVPAESLDSLEAGLRIAPAIAARVERVRQTVAQLDRRIPPIPMTRYVFPDTVGAVHYGEPDVLRWLRWTPYFWLAGTLLLLLIGFWALALIRQSEKRTIWVGMAKETAHQLGTPLSSLMGWSEMLRSHVPLPARGEARIAAAELSETVAEMERDIERLRKIADRFSNVGSEPNLQTQDPTPVVQDVVGYMRRRIPRSGREVELVDRMSPVPAVRLNAELLEWALENLISNALSALDKRAGRVEVALGTSADGHAVEITVADNGRGMSAREVRRAFEPGYTTKRRGWGLGLALAKRVVEDYHRGRIWIRSSVPGEGTTLAIRLPPAR